MSHVDGVDDGVGHGVSGSSYIGTGVRASSSGGPGVLAMSLIDAGVIGYTVTSFGVLGESYNHIGVYGRSDFGNGVSGFSPSSTGVFGRSYNRIGVRGLSDIYYGVDGQSDTSSGVHGFSFNGIGVHGESHDYIGVYGRSDDYIAIYGRSKNGYAAWLDGNVKINGTLQKGGGSFKIDHPLYPANKYLSHSFVESPDMKNVYDGVVALDQNGEAVVELPDWFSALNKDFRYQLTAIGAPAPNLYIAQDISDVLTNNSSDSSKNNNSSHFKIAGGTSAMKVSWQVTGIRKDPWANANRIQVEEDKPAKEQGYYTYPELYGQPEEKGMTRLLFPEEKWQVQPVIENRQPKKII